MESPFLNDTDFFKSHALDDHGNLLKARRATVGEVRTWKGKKYQKTAQGWKPYKEKTAAGKATGKSAKIEKFISGINPNAKNWGEATDEIVDLHKDMAERYNEMGGSYKFPETKSKTPSEWNKKHVAGVKTLLSKMKPEDIKYIEDNLGFEVKEDKKEKGGLYSKKTGDKVSITGNKTGTYLRWKGEGGKSHNINIPEGNYIVTNKKKDTLIIAAELSPGVPSQKHFYEIRKDWKPMKNGEKK